MTCLVLFTGSEFALPVVTTFHVHGFPLTLLRPLRKGFHAWHHESGKAGQPFIQTYFPPRPDREGYSQNKTLEVPYFLVGETCVPGTRGGVVFEPCKISGWAHRAGGCSG